MLLPACSAWFETRAEYSDLAVKYLAESKVLAGVAQKQCPNSQERILERLHLSTLFLQEYYNFSGVPIEQNEVSSVATIIEDFNNFERPISKTFCIEALQNIKDALDILVLQENTRR